MKHDRFLFKDTNTWTNKYKYLEIQIHCQVEEIQKHCQVESELSSAQR